MAMVATMAMPHSYEQNSWVLLWNISPFAPGWKVARHCKIHQKPQNSCTCLRVKRSVSNPTFSFSSVVFFFFFFFFFVFFFFFFFDTPLGKVESSTLDVLVSKTELSENEVPKNRVVYCRRTEYGTIKSQETGNIWKIHENPKFYLLHHDSLSI